MSSNAGFISLCFQSFPLLGEKDVSPSSRTPRISVALLALILAGCGGSDRPSMYPVTGTVTYDGKSLENASVVFVQENGLVSVGRTDSSGHFSLKTQGSEGAPAGSYQVTVTAVKETKKVTPEEFEKLSDSERAKLSKSRIPARYSHPATSELSASVKEEGANEISLSLTP